MAAEKKSIDELTMDPTSLYREETITDRRVGTIRILSPINSAGDSDTERDTMYVGETQIMTPMGALPITFQIDAKTIDEAVEKYGDSGKVAVEKAVKEIQEMRREAASSIVLPENVPGGMPGAGSGGGIQMP